jgi:electron transport complex protein RnfD
MLKDITVTPSPHIHASAKNRWTARSTQAVMLDVIIGLMPAMFAAGLFFRHYALVLIGACVISALAAEWVCNLVQGKPNSLGDLSAVVTGIILALSVPPALPVWAAVIGSCFSVVIGKMVFGGLGANIFNPAMAGRAFLTASFGVLMTTWTVPATIDAKMPQISAGNKIDARTEATPLAYSKQAIKTKQGAEIVSREWKNYFWGTTGGCLGETSTLALLIGGAYLLVRRTISWQIPAAVVISVVIIAFIAYEINPQANITPLAHLMTGGIMIGAFFIATDPVTAPLTIRGRWIFGFGVGALIMLIRIVGEYPEGVMYAVLLMNGVTPLIDRAFKLTPAGGKPHV